MSTTVTPNPLHEASDKAPAAPKPTVKADVESARKEESLPLPEEIFPALNEYAIGFSSSAWAFVAVIATMYIAVVAQINVQGGANRNAPVVVQLTYALDMLYPLVICFAVFIVAAEVTIRRYFYFEFLRNGYMISWAKTYTRIWQPNYWLRPSYGVFPHTVVLWTLLLALSTRGAQASLQIVLIQVVTLFFNFGTLIDLSQQSPPFAVVFFETKEAAKRQSAETESDTAEELESALQETCTSLSKFTMIDENLLINQVSYLQFDKKFSKMDPTFAIPMFGADGGTPIGLRDYPPYESLVEARKGSEAIAEFFLNIVTGFMWKRLWGIKLWIILLENFSSSKKERVEFRSKILQPRHKAPAIMFAVLGFVAMTGVLVLEIYGLVTGANTAKAQMGQTCSLVDADKDLATQCRSNACLQVTCSQC